VKSSQAKALVQANLQAKRVPAAALTLPSSKRKKRKKTWAASDIAELRKRVGYTQKQFAAALGVSQSFISLLEKGARKPNRELVQKLASLAELAEELEGLEDYL